MLELPEVTLWTMVWAEDRKWIVKAGQVLRYCLTLMHPGRVILFVNQPIAVRDYPWETIRIPQLSWQSYNIFVNRVVPTYIKTEFAMSVHEDGFPLEEGLWRPEFLGCDYIGAPWSDGVVGNGGFNLESRKLMNLKCDLAVGEAEFTIPSDRLVCDVRRSYFCDQGVKFAPYDLALAFSTEQVGNELPSFGFHGRSASRDKYQKGWKKIMSMPFSPTHPVSSNFNLVRNRVVPPAFRRVGPQAVPRVPEPRPSQVAVLPPVVFPPVEQMSVTVVYVYPMVAAAKFKTYAQRFLESYRQHPPGASHDTVVVLNGGRESPELREQFKCLPGLRFLYHDNSGYDLGAYQKACRDCASDLIVFFGASTFFGRAGWLRAMKDATARRGHALYGAMGNRGDARYRVWPHIRTTAFWMHPSLLNAYPHVIRKAIERHSFEHGPDCFTGWVKRHGLKAWVATWSGEYEWEHWDDDPQGFQRGIEANVLAGDHICEPPYYTPK